MPSSVVPNISALEETLDIPQLTQEEMDATHIDWVIKAWKNKPRLFEKHLAHVLSDKSIGIHFGNLGALPVDVSDQFIRETWPQLKSGSRSMLRTFRNDFKIGDTILISQGLEGCLYVAEIASTYYFQPDPDTEFCQHRMKIRNIRRVPDTFTRRPLVQTLSAYETV